MRCGHHHTNFSRVAFSEGCVSSSIFAGEEASSDFAISGLPLDILASLPGAARHEYLAAYRRARSLAMTAVIPAIEKGQRDKGGSGFSE